MINALIELGMMGATLIAALFVVFAAVLAPMAWYEGHAKAAYLKRTQGVEMPWYQASWLDVEAIPIKASPSQH